MRHIDLYFFEISKQFLIFCVTSCSSLVRALVCQSSGPGSIPGMSRSETAIRRGNLIMLLPPTTFCVLLVKKSHNIIWWIYIRTKIKIFTCTHQCEHLLSGFGNEANIKKIMRPKNMRFLGTSIINIFSNR